MIIYKTTNIINGNFYIGQDSKNNPMYLGSGKLLNRAIKKYGRSSFKKEIIETCLSKQELNEREIFWINKLEPIYNIAKGGNGGDTITNHPDYNLIIEKLKLRIPHKWTELDKDRQRGDKNPAKRVEVREKISKAKLGKPRPDQLGDLNSAKHPDVRKKIQLKLKGVPKQKIKCPYCDKEGQPSNMYRWHYTNCKFKKEK
jgi:group I intron endonuclease